jgi:DNA-binding beta-propeller fold protein YncE
MKLYAFLGLALLVPPLRAADFKVIAHYPVGGDVRFDHLRVDPGMRRLYVSHANQVDVLDVDTGSPVGVVAPMHGVHGIAVVPGLGKGYITAGTDRTVVAFDLTTLRIVKVITGLGVKPDAVEFNPATRRISVANGQSGGITVIDPARDVIEATIPVPGKPEGDPGFLRGAGRGPLSRRRPAGPTPRPPPSARAARGAPGGSS